MTRKPATVWLTLVIALTLSAGAFAHAQTKNPVPKPQRYKLTGKVKSVDVKKRELVVQHNDIPGFMAAMTMPYNAGKAEDLKTLSPGDEIQADVVVNDGETHLENIKVTGHTKGKDNPK